MKNNKKIIKTSIGNHDKKKDIDEEILKEMKELERKLGVVQGE